MFLVKQEDTVVMIRSPWFRVSLVVLIFAIAGSQVAASEGRDEPVGRTSGGGDSIQWQPSVSVYDSIHLTVMLPNGDAITRTFKAGTAPLFRLQDLPGTDTADGTYHYELRVVPRVSDSLAKDLAEARAAGKDEKARALLRANGLGNAVVQSGAFTVMNGSIVATDREETTPRKIASDANRPSLEPVVQDQVIPDDLITQGSLCVGFDCVNNESFGFDTIRLKENNLRIHFDDTSTIAGYSANDWRIVANDSASGGASKFSIEDSTGNKTPFTITGGAATNSIFVNSTGRVGFRTSTPILDLHISTSDTPAVRFEQNSSGGWTAQTWDIAGNESNFFVRDVTAGSRLPLRIRPGAPTSSIDISADGNTGFGTSSPTDSARADFSDTEQLKARIALTGQEFYQAGNTSTDGIAILLGVNRSGNRQIWFGDTAQLTQNSTNRVIRFYPNNGEISAIATDGSTVKNLILQNSGGSVGIGTSAPSSKLHVNGGDIRVSGGSFIDDGVTLYAPDYVFETDYPLMPLDRVAQFVRAERHLPNVPSAATIKSEGLNVSQFQMRLLEKVEELMLYVIAQHEENKELAERIAQLEAKLAEQQK